MKRVPKRLPHTSVCLPPPSIPPPQHCSLDELDASTASISAGVSGSVRDLSAAVTALSQDKAERVYVDDNLALKVDTDRCVASN